MAVSDAPKPYVIRQGDTLLRIALAKGMEPERIWDEAKNKKLKEIRDPDILAPGDILHIPPPPAPSLSLAPQTSNRYRAKVPEVEVEIIFHGEAGPLANEAYKVTGIEEDPIEGTLDGTGTFKKKVPVFLEHFTIAFPEREIEHTVWPGHLDPLDVTSGVLQRLLHMGHGPIAQKKGDPFVFTDTDAEKAAVSGFQDAHGLEKTGFADEKTQEKLKKKHGI